MRSPVETFARRYAPGLILAAALAGCGSHEELASASGAGTAIVANGPAADYPMVIGDPYRIGASRYAPADVMNYDEVGYAVADSGSGVTGSHHTLPLPSYVEVTSLTSGKTILVRLTRRGPMDGDALVALSPTAFVQLGVSAGEPVRVRRVNPPEEERAALRAGRLAPPRMDTPASLVAVLKRKLSGASSVALTPRSAAPVTVAATSLPVGTPSQQPHLQTIAASPKVSSPGHKVPPSVPPLPPLAVHGKEFGVAPVAAPVVVARLEEPSRASVTAAPASKAPPVTSAYVVQAATMSTLERAQKVAGTIGGSVSQAGRYFRVRTGPFASRAQAEASLAKVRAAGYSDARISTNG
uniref:SPOR domain-containing protein n=1 Tax=Altererythrobacter segetis TaxID=1104773 RepID=UPI00140BDF08|nr:SPOR domain-containing protein [Altererythrobacter segetis]